MSLAKTVCFFDNSDMNSIIKIKKLTLLNKKYRKTSSMAYRGRVVDTTVYVFIQ